MLVFLLYNVYCVCWINLVYLKYKIIIKFLKIEVKFYLVCVSLNVYFFFWGCISEFYNWSIVSCIKCNYIMWIMFKKWY